MDQVLWVGKFQENESGSNAWENSILKHIKPRGMELEPESKGKPECGLV